jgi:hypothetical protein
MAEYIRFRLTAAKVGVTVTFFALLAGLADKARAVPLIAKPAASANFLKEISIPTGGGVDRIVIQKLDSALAALEHKLATSFESTHKINQTFLKIKSADTTFLKIKSANANFLKVDSANANFLKVDSANVDFLKIDDANSEFLKIDDANADFLTPAAAGGQFLKLSATAADSSELGGLTPDAFFQGSGHVVSGAATVSGGTGTTQLLALPGDIIAVSVSGGAGNGVDLTIHNGTAVSLPAVQANAGGSSPQAITLAPNADKTVSLGSAPATETHLQIFPSGLAFPDVVTLIVSTVQTVGAPGATVVGQAFAGGITAGA